MRRWISWTLALATITAAAPISSAAPVVVTMWGWQPGSTNGDLFARYIAEFESTHPNILIKVDKGSNEQKLIAAYAGGVAPDIIQGVGPWATDLGPKGVLLPLDSFIDGPNGIPRGDYVDDLWSFSRVNGKTYQVAVDSNERALYVNTDAAADSGIDVSQPMRDWNDLLAWARKMVRKTGDRVDRWGFDAYQENGGNRWHWVWLNEGDILAPDGTHALLDNPNTVAALKFAGDLVNTYGVSPKPHTVKGSSRANFKSGTYAMIMTSSSFVTELQAAGEHFITIAGPPGPGKKGYRFSGATASTLSILSTSKHPQEAWTFIRWLAYEKGIQFANDRGLLPYLKKGLQSGRYMAQPWEAFATSILTFGPRNAYRAGVSESDWTGKFQVAWDNVLKGQKSAPIALDEAQQAIDARLAELHAK